MENDERHGLTRRGFLGATAGATAGTALLAVGTGPAAAAAGPADTVRAATDAWPIAEPYPPVHGGGFTGPRVKESPDPLVAYRWPDPKADDGLQVYRLRPAAVVADPPESFGNLSSVTTARCDVAVRGTGSIRVDFGVESPAWLEFDSPDFSGTVELSISEYNVPGKVNPGPPHPDKTLAPQRYGDTFRLELNPDLYEGVRFGWIHVRTFDQPWHITAVRAVCQAKPTNYNGRFACSDPQLTRIWYAGAYGVRVGFQHDYMGAILMDRGDRYGWSGDCNPIQAAALVAFGDTDFVKANLARTADDNQGIESYSLYWVLSLLEYHRHTGDADTLRSYIDNVRGKLDHAETLYAAPQSTFFGWDERLGAGFEAPNRPETAAVYRGMYRQACREFADAMDGIGRSDVAGPYRAAADRHDAELHADPDWFGPLGVHARAHAVNARSIRPRERQGVVAGEFDDRLNRLSFSTFNQYPILQAMTALGRTDDAIVTARDNWGGQLDYGGTTFFEVYRPDWNKILGPNDPVPNSQSGWTSLSHPWGGGVTAWLSHDVLGITPRSPGYDTVDVFPRPGRTLSWVSGSVPTPHGDVSVSYDIRTGSGTLRIPPGSRGRLGIPSDGRKVRVVRVGRKVVWDGRYRPVPGIGAASADGDSVVLDDIAPGTYTLSVVQQGRRPAAHRPGPMRYPMRFAGQDRKTAGDWGGVYGRDGQVLFNYDGMGHDRSDLPDYVESVSVWRTGWSGARDAVWVAGTDERRALAADRSNGGARAAACVYTTTPNPGGMTMPVDIAVRPNTSFQMALYFVDWDSTARRLAVEVFDLATRKLVAPEQLVDDFHGGAWLVYDCDRSVRVRVAHVLGDNAVLSGVFFGPAGSAVPR
ncbi:alpha-L-rhamnosidase [Actinacidiphila alni]|uniref:Alpha-L-rhamnosidase n=1 Tax=Actinacidiphila alni TaxID=380248 RepID=A0A1I2H9P7_9ACTN|nr:alpha-L-rhamnosidase C-terminal domain-containing protein [Actinacidiphila alni]SFF25697.1 alpha-L-rhamnosidase [Actinacidiphila alni]